MSTKPLEDVSLLEMRFMKCTLKINFWRLLVTFGCLSYRANTDELFHYNKSTIYSLNISKFYD